MPLRAGHFVSFVAGTRIAHCFVNRGSCDCVTLTVGERKRRVDRPFYAEDTEHDAFFAKEHPERYWSTE